MFNHINSICPYCKVHVTFSWTEAGERGGNLRDWLHHYFKNEKGIWTIGNCPNCKNCVLINGHKQDHTFILEKIYPFPLPSPTDSRIPEKIRKDIEEAKLCFSVKAFRASVGMCRRALQQACIEKMATEKDLIKQIDEISSKGTITKDLRDLAHSIRWVGNDALHPNEEDVNEEDAKEILSLAEQFMEIVFVAPAKVKEIKEKRNKNAK